MPAWTAMTDIEWASTSCRSWAIRRRSSVTAVAARWRSDSARWSAKAMAARADSSRQRIAAPRSQATTAARTTLVAVASVKRGAVRVSTTTTQTAQARPARERFNGLRAAIVAISR